MFYYWQANCQYEAVADALPVPSLCAILLRLVNVPTSNY